MNELLNKIKEMKLNKKTVFLFAAGILAVVVFIFAETSEGEYVGSASSQYSVVSSSEYIKNTEKELERLISEIGGAGETDVMITLESCYENVYAKSYKNDKSQSDSKDEDAFEEEYVIIKKGSSNEESLVIKVYEPQIKGVAVVCRGGDVPLVKKAITEMVCALFDISSAAVSVSKMTDS